MASGLAAIFVLNSSISACCSLLFRPWGGEREGGRREGGKEEGRVGGREGGREERRGREGRKEKEGGREGVNNNNIYNNIYVVII